MDFTVFRTIYCILCTSTTLSHQSSSGGSFLYNYGNLAVVAVLFVQILEFGSLKEGVLLKCLLLLLNNCKGLVSTRLSSPRGRGRNF